MKKLFIALFILLIPAVSSAVDIEALISAKTAAETVTFEVRYGSPATIIAQGLTGAEEIPLQIEYSAGNYMNIYDADEEQIVLKATRNIIPIFVPGNYQVVKSTTSGTVSVSLYRGQK